MAGSWRLRKFRSLSEDKHYFIDIPELYGRCIRGSSHGWLFAIDIKITCILINPFTRGFFELPPFPYYCSRCDVKLVEVPNDDDDEPYFTYESMQRLILYKGVLSHDPKVRSDFTALILFGETHEVAIWRPGDASWMVIKGPTCALADVTYLNGNFYVISFNSTLYAVELGSDPKIIQIHEPRIMPSLMSCHNYIVDFKGRLLHIDRFQDLVEDRHFITEGFELRVLDFEENKLLQWDDINDCAIFIGANSPVAFDASQFSGCKNNSFYFTDLSIIYSEKKFGYGDIGIFDYVTKTISRFYSPDIIHSYVANPVWITPNPW
jgi:Protein of unknown function (DUF295)